MPSKGKGEEEKHNEERKDELRPDSEIDVDEEMKECYEDFVRKNHNSLFTPLSPQDIAFCKEFVYSPSLMKVFKFSKNAPGESVSTWSDVSASFQKEIAKGPKDFLLSLGEHYGEKMLSEKFLVALPFGATAAKELAKFSGKSAMATAIQAATIACSKMQENKELMHKFDKAQEWIAKPYQYKGDRDSVYDPWNAFNDDDDLSSDSPRVMTSSNNLSIADHMEESFQNVTVPDGLKKSYEDWVLLDDATFWMAHSNVMKHNTIPRAEQMVYMNYMAGLMPVSNYFIFEWDDVDRNGLVRELIEAYQKVGLTYAMYEYLGTVVNGSVPRSVGCECIILALYWMDKVSILQANDGLLLRAISQSSSTQAWWTMWHFFTTASFALPGGAFWAAGMGLIEAIVGKGHESALSNFFQDMKAVLDVYKAEQFGDILYEQTCIVADIQGALAHSTSKTIEKEMQPGHFLHDKVSNANLSDQFTSTNNTLRYMLDTMYRQKEKFWYLADMYCTAVALIHFCAILYVDLNLASQGPNHEIDHSLYGFMESFLRGLIDNTKDFVDYAKQKRLEQLSPNLSSKISGNVNSISIEERWFFNDEGIAFCSQDEIIQEVAKNDKSVATYLQQGAIKHRHGFSWRYSYTIFSKPSTRRKKERAANKAFSMYKAALSSLLEKHFEGVLENTDAYKDILDTWANGQMPLPPSKAPDLMKWVPSDKSVDDSQKNFWKKYDMVQYALANTSKWGTTSNFIEIGAVDVPDSSTCPTIHISSYDGDESWVSQRDLYRKLHTKEGDWTDYKKIKSFARLADQDFQDKDTVHEY